jgi:hypothetical protein
MFRSYLSDRARNRRPLALDQLDPVTVRVVDEAQPRATLAHTVRLALGFDPLLAQAGQRPVEVVDAYRDVSVRRAELVGARRSRGANCGPTDPSAILRNGAICRGKAGELAIAPLVAQRRLIRLFLTRGWDSEGLRCRRPVIITTVEKLPIYSKEVARIAIAL